MTRIALIAAALFAGLAAAAAGGFAYFKPAFIFGAPPSDATAAHGIPTYPDEASEESQSRRYALRLVEQLGAVQDRIIRGDRTALTDQARLLSEIAREVQNFSDDEWSDYVNVRTSLLYVLSGGDAQVLNSIVGKKTLSIADQRLAAGIMSFAEGQLKRARELFDDIDPRSLDVSLVAPFSLARASLYLKDDRAKAVELLDDARLTGPHTAIEEAAARREIPILIDMGETDRAWMLTASYVREFGRSIYAWKLFRDLSQAIAKRPELDDAAIVDELVGGLGDKVAQPVSELLIDIAGEGLLQGRLKLAKAAANSVREIETALPETRDKAALYAAAAEAPSDDAVDAMKALDQIATDRFSDEDMEIREVAGFIAHAVVAGTGPGAPSLSSPPLSNSADARSDIVPEAGVKKAAAALSSADAILNKADYIISGSGK